MTVRIHHHAEQRAIERGAEKTEIINTVENGEQFPAKYSRTGFRKNFPFNSKRNTKQYSTKQIEAYCVKQDDDWLVITVLVKYF